ncbi:xylulokinase [Sulfitobacter guttiformis]|uniref:Xylulose kinase n=1 Tax=Sulfitobacter guttiformis TaxID=74349 RepID=A0A420DUC4_9RHOB|nr:xylulokinase [Sulfitobacter guttiformis]KIN71497.1 Xylulokinase [Sulfitobacter guttiformis KCTC 32187]RKE97924.1 xylulokinase [Sulfitobacter guttiformis]
MSFLGIDIGTSGLRALLVDGNGAPIGSAEQAFTTFNPHPGWSEQDPADWIAALEAAIATLRAKYPAFEGLKGIGVAGQMHGAVLLDEDDAVLRPCMLWNDTRSHREARTLDALPDFRALTGNIVFAGFTAPKLDWLRSHEPDIFRRTAKVVLPAGYLNHYLTGDHVADMSDSAGTSWLDVGGREWSDTLLAHSNMRAGQMPRLVEGSEKAGSLRASLARDWGLSGEVIIAGGAGDNAAAACGLGLLEEGEGFVSLGTSGVLLLARDRYHPDPQTAVHSFCHAVPERWYQMSVMLSAADCLTWLSSITGARAEALTFALGDDLQPPGRVQFFPYLSGERTPHNDAEIRAGFVGLGKDTDRDALTRAVLEGVCFGLRDGFEALISGGSKPAHLFAIGGGSTSRYWLSLLATVIKTPLHLPEGREFGAAMGAARLGMTATLGAPVSEIMGRVPTAEIIEPIAALTDAYDAAYLAFRAGYHLLKSHTAGGEI